MVQSTQTTPDKGQLKISTTSRATSVPIENAKISISYTGVPENTIEELTTNSSGNTEIIDLPSPPEEYSLNPQILSQPYSEYNLIITAPGFETVNISGTEILANTLALQNVRMNPLAPGETPQIFVNLWSFFCTKPDTP